MRERVPIDKSYISTRISIDDNGCWLWKHALNDQGYGIAMYKKVGSKTMFHLRMHRASYELYKGKIPDGLVLDHLCRVRNCINPEHLDPVTNKVNLLRSPYFNKTICIRGHKFTSDNTYYRPNGHKYCRTCRRMLDNQNYRKGKKCLETTP